MARRRAVLLDLDDHRICIAVGKNFDDVLSVTGFLSFHPILVASAAVKPGLSVAQCVGESLFVHESNHQNFTIFMVLDDGRNQAAHFFKINLSHSCVPPG